MKLRVPHCCDRPMMAVLDRKNADAPVWFCPDCHRKIKRTEP